MGFRRHANALRGSAVPASRLSPLPAEVGTEQAAALPLVGLIALRTLRLAG